MKNKIENWLRTLRKKNSSVVFATQGLDEIKKSSIYSVILDQCKTKIYLPNENALTHQDLYIEMGLNLSEIEKLKRATPKKDYLYKSERGSNMISFDLSPLELAYVGSSNTKDLNKIVEMKEKITDIEKLNEILSSKVSEKSIGLDKKIPIHIIYLTSWVDENGVL